ncbi:hypothetical protein [Streptomyces sp. NPDC001568]|uniref:hypothetical protein n=1 Tax=Streptomyces sp. NPDC001568 TaxID=3364588 RepID=UPI0036C4EE19
MFIRPAGPTVTAATRPSGHPLLRGLLRRAAGAAEWTQGEELEREREREEWERTGWGEGGEGTAAGPGGAADAIADLEGDAEAWGVAGRGAGVRGDATEGAADAEAPEAAALPEAARTDGANTPGTPEQAPTTQVGLAAELTQLAALAREGLLTPHEFTTAKSKLLRG